MKKDAMLFDWRVCARFFLHRPSKDIDVVAVGHGIALAEAVARKLGRKCHLSVFKNSGTAQLKYKDYEIEFVGAEKNHIVTILVSQ